MSHTRTCAQSPPPRTYVYVYVHACVGGACVMQRFLSCAQSVPKGIEVPGPNPFCLIYTSPPSPAFYSVSRSAAPFSRRRRLELAMPGRNVFSAVKDVTSFYNIFKERCVVTHIQNVDCLPSVGLVEKVFAGCPPGAQQEFEAGYHSFLNENSILSCSVRLERMMDLLEYFCGKERPLTYSETELAVPLRTVTSFHVPGTAVDGESEHNRGTPRPRTILLCVLCRILL